MGLSCVKGCVGVARVALQQRRLQQPQCSPACCMCLKSRTAYPRPRWYTWEVPFFCLLGVAGGLLGALWSWLTCRLLAFRARHIPASRPVRRVLEVVTVATLTATVRVCFPAMMPSIPPKPAGVAQSAAGAVWLLAAAGTAAPQLRLLLSSAAVGS